MQVVSHVKLLPYQRRLLNSRNPFTFAICGRGAGKTYSMSLIAMIKFLSGQNVLISAQRFDSLRDVLWKQILARIKDFGLEGCVKLSKAPIRAELNDFSIYTTSYEALDGARGLDDIGCIMLDEVGLAPLDVLDVLAPCLRGPHVQDPCILGATTPRMDSLWNYRFAKVNGCEDWEIIKATTYDNWTLTKKQLDIIERAVQTPEMKRQELYAEIILGADTASIIKIEDFPSYYQANSDTRVIAGLDCAHGGERDCFGWFKRKGNEILDIKEFRHVSHEWVTKYILESHQKLPISMLNMDLAWSEYEYNVLKYHFPCRQVAFAERASEGNERQYANIRAEMYFNAAWAVKNGFYVGLRSDALLYDADGNPIGSEEIAHLRQQLCAVTWKRDRQGRLLLIEKEELRKLLGCSPDIGDAFCLTFLDRYTADDPAMKPPQGLELSRSEVAQIMSED